MNPGEFAFTLTVPTDARFLAVVRELVLQATTYAELPLADGTALADRVAAVLQRAASSAGSCSLTFERAGGRLTIAVGGDVIAHPR